MVRGFGFGFDAMPCKSEDPAKAHSFPRHFLQTGGNVALVFLIDFWGHSLFWVWGLRGVWPCA